MFRAKDKEINTNLNDQIWIIVPAYNAEKTLPNLLSQLIVHLPPINIVVIDDGSTDTTRIIPHQFNVHCISHKSNRGKGKALQSGLDFVVDNKGKWAITIDADLQHDPGRIPSFIDLINSDCHDIICGYREFVKSSMPIDRHFSNWSTSLLLSKITGNPIKDAQCGYRAIRLELLKDMHFSSSHYEFETEILLKLLRKGAKIGWVSVPTIYNREKSSINRIKDTYRFLKVVIQNQSWI